VLAGAQISEFYESQDRFLCIGFARPLVLSPDVRSSVIAGFRVNRELPETIRFAADPAIPVVTINETCERCPLPPEVCTVRAVPPYVLMAEAEKEARQATIRRLTRDLQPA
jgi:hypothetical protein